MKFKSLRINGFGKFTKKTVDFKPGINVIYGENEAGKSSLLKFLSSMLYGASKNKNGKPIPDAEKYKPWETSDFSGSLEYELDNGESYDVFREFKKKNPVVYNGDKKDITSTFKENKTKGIAFFEEQTGIDEETYYNTAIIEQEEVKLDKASQNTVVQKISNKVSTGDDNVSYKKTLALINKLQGDKVGTSRTQNKPINRVNYKISSLEAKRKELEEIKESISSSDSELEAFKEKINAEEKLKDEKMKRLSESPEEPDVQEEVKTPIYIYIFIAITYLISILLFIFIEYKILALCDLLIAIGFSTLVYLRKKSKKKNLESKKEAENKTKEDKLKLLTEDIKSSEQTIEKMKRELYEIEFCQKADNQALEELTSIVEKLDDLYEEKQELESLNNSYEIAKECLERAYEEVKKNISPRFTENLCKNIAQISNGKYDFVKVSEEGLVVRLENGSYVPAERLSIGTIDQLYLSLRLSAIKEVSDEKMPIILDEAFAYYDNERLNNILNYLNTEYKDYQILIFTCSNREKEILEANNIEYNLINLEK